MLKDLQGRNILLIFVSLLTIKTKRIMKTIKRILIITFMALLTISCQDDDRSEPIIIDDNTPQNFEAKGILRTYVTYGHFEVITPDSSAFRQDTILSQVDTIKTERLYSISNKDAMALDYYKEFNFKHYSKIEQIGDNKYKYTYNWLRTDLTVF